MTNGKYTYVIKQDLEHLCREYVRLCSDERGCPKEDTESHMFFFQVRWSITASLTSLANEVSTDCAIQALDAGVRNG